MLLVFMSVISKWKVYILLPEGVKTTPDLEQFGITISDVEEGDFNNTVKNIHTAGFLTSEYTTEENNSQTSWLPI